MSSNLSGSVSMETVSGFYELQIQNYSTCSKANKDYTTSPQFRLCGYNWHVRVYFGGNKLESADYVSIFLFNGSDSEIGSVTYRFILCDMTSSINTASHVESEPDTRDFLPEGDNWGEYRFFKQDLLTKPNSPYVVNGTVTFRVEIKINQHLLNSTPASNTSNVISCLGDMFSSGLGSDVTLVVESEKNQAHKCILMARSPVFKAMFTHNMSESNTNEILISDFSPEVIREMIHFMYTDKLQSENILGHIVYEGLLGAAMKYDIVSLVSLCEAHYINHLSDDNLIHTYSLAESCGSEKLKHGVMTHIENNSENFVKRAEFKAVLPEIMDLLANNVEAGTGMLELRKETGSEHEYRV